MRPVSWDSNFLILLVCCLLFRRFIGHRCHHGNSHFTLYSSGIPRDFLVHGKPATAIETYFDCLLITVQNPCNSVARDEQTTSETHRFPW